MAQGATDESGRETNGNAQASTSTLTSLPSVAGVSGGPPLHSPPSDGEDRALKKQKRVTKACDQCRRRRIKCEAYLNAPTIDSPCVVCTEQGTANECTFTRPTRKRGPQAGLTKNLAERITGLERFVGYLIMTEGEDSLLRRYRTFFNQDGTSTDAKAQLNAWNRSQLPQLLENLVLNPGPAKYETRDSEFDVPLQDVRMDVSSPVLHLGSVQMETEPSPVGSASNSTPASCNPPSRLPSSTHGLNNHPLNSTSPFGTSHIDAVSTTHMNLNESALQTLAHAAIPDYYLQESGVLGPHEVEGVGAGLFEASFESLSLPDEGIRNQLLDIYFHQIIHPTLPILDKGRFFSWSAHLPVNHAATSPAARSLPAELYLSVFAVVAPYLQSESTHSSEVFASAARAHLFAALHKPSLETVQASVLLAVADWGLSELSRAWITSSVSIALAITLGMHRQPASASFPNDPGRLRTFHSAVIVHTLLSLRLSRTPIVLNGDYDTPLPTTDGAENFELWRLGHDANHLRGEYGLAQLATSARWQGAVRSATLSMFSNLASLSTLGLAVLRWSLRVDSEHDDGEHERQNLVNALVAWERGLPPELMIGDPSARDAERVHERSRAIIEMHMMFHAIYAKLSPSTRAIATNGRAFYYDPAPESISMLLDLTKKTRELFSYLRTMPLVEMVLDVLVQAGYGEEESVRGAYEELGRVHRLGRPAGSDYTQRSQKALIASRATVPNPPVLPSSHSKVSNPSAAPRPSFSSNPPTPVSLSAANLENNPVGPAGITTEPYQAFLSYSDLLGPTAPASTVLDFGSWDQSELLVSLGLVDPTAGTSAWHPPPPASTGPKSSIRGESGLLQTSSPGSMSFSSSGSAHNNASSQGQSHPQHQQSMMINSGTTGEVDGGQFMLDHIGQGTDLVSRWLDRGSWAGIDVLGAHPSTSGIVDSGLGSDSRG